MTTLQAFDFRVLGALLLAAALVAIICQRWRLPYSAGLVVAGLVMAALAPGTTPPLTPGLIFFIFLPPLVFEAAIQIPWTAFRRELPLLTALVTVGVLLAAGVVAVGMRWLIGWSWLGAGLFGVLIAATDPVSVIAAFKQLRVRRRLHLLVETESLLNDGVAAVGFAVLTGIAAAGGTVTAGALAGKLALTVIGGIGCGATTAVVLVLLLKGTEDRLVEVALTQVIAYGSFLLAENLGCSGVLATLTAGMIVGNWGFMGSITAEGRRSVRGHWEFVAFLINSMIFLLIGGQSVHMPVGAVLTAALAAIVLTLVGRAATVYPITILFARTRLRVPWGYKHVLFWGGLRGALALALALALPASLPERSQIVTVAFAVVGFSILVQGLTMPWLIGRLGLRAPATVATTLAGASSPMLGIAAEPPVAAPAQGTSTVSVAIGSVSGQSSV